MARTLISPPPSALLAPPLPSLLSRGRRDLSSLYRPRRTDVRVRMSFHEVPSPESIDLHGLVERVEGFLYTMADAAVVAEPSTSGATAGATDAAVQKSGGWFGFISDAMEVVLKVLKDGLSAVHVPYAYGFAIILLTVIVKIATLPLTKKQVESTLAMQNLQPKIKAIQKRYAGNQMARDILAIPASSVASESAFSTGGRVLDAFRSRLNPKTVEALVCTGDWIRSEKQESGETDDEEDDEKEEKEDRSGTVPLPTIQE